MTWNLHVVRNKDGSPKPNTWDYCSDPECTEPHVEYVPFHPIIEKKVDEGEGGLIT